jgi:hypothetical protein
MERAITPRSVVSPLRPLAQGGESRSESSFVPDLEWDAPIRGNVAFHQSSRKVGGDGVAIYEKSQYGEGVLDLLLKNPHMIRMARPHLSAWNGVPPQAQVPKRPSPEPVNARLPIIEPRSKQVLAVPVGKPIEKQAKPAQRSQAALQLSLTLMRSLRELRSMSGRAKVLQCCNHLELLEAREICQSLLSRLAEQAATGKA